MLSEVVPVGYQQPGLIIQVALGPSHFFLPIGFRRSGGPQWLYPTGGRLWVYLVLRPTFSWPEGTFICTVFVFSSMWLRAA